MGLTDGTGMDTASSLIRGGLQLDVDFEGGGAHPVRNRRRWQVSRLRYMIGN